MTAGEAPALGFARRVERGGGWHVRRERAADAGFLETLFIANAPLAGVLPDAMLRQQHHIQAASFAAQFPAAMRCILERGDEAVGRIIIDWSGDGAVHGVDIAVLPDARGRGGGLAMLRAWLAVADALGRPCTLNVVAANRARLLYRRLGFVETGSEGPDAPIIAMTRAVGG